jgi:RNA polymerase sigma-70 factor (ECF subfamily)
MRKPAEPDVHARIDVNSGLRVPVTRDHRGFTSTVEDARVKGLCAAGDDAILNDAWLVEHSRHGDQQAFAVLVRRYERKLIRVLMRLVHQPDQARDLAQETFWHVYTCLDRFDTARRFGPWLFRVGINLAVDWLRSKKNDPQLVRSIDRSGRDGQPIFEIPDPDPQPQAELAQEVRFILSLMPLSYRTILILRDLEGFSSSEVAAIVGRRESTIRWRLSTARARFREIWQRRQEGAPAVTRDGRSRSR